MYYRRMEITKREILASVSIIAVLLMVGMWLSGLITDARLDRDEIYNKAAKITDGDIFEYGMRTNVGNAFVYGDLLAVDTVTYPEIGGEYMYVRKVTERYTMHTRVVTRTRTVNGKTQTYTTTENYWSWDEIHRESKMCSEISFAGVVLPSNKIDIPGVYKIDTIKESSKIRYVYYGVGTKYVGTIFADLRDGTIPDGTRFYSNNTIEETVEQLQSFNWNILFWIFWIGLTAVAVYGFYYLENNWLE